MGRGGEVEVGGWWNGIPGFVKDRGKDHNSLLLSESSGLAFSAGGRASGTVATAKFVGTVTTRNPEREPGVATMSPSLKIKWFRTRQKMVRKKPT